jgi:hypothetical protein
VENHEKRHHKFSLSRFGTSGWFETMDLWGFRVSWNDNFVGSGEFIIIIWRLIEIFVSMFLRFFRGSLVQLASLQKCWLPVHLDTMQTSVLKV